MTRSSGRADPVVTALAGIAAVLGVLSLLVLGWYRDTGAVVGGGSGTTFGDLHRVLDNARDGNGFSFGISPQYFGWLGYVLVALAVVGALAAAVTAAGTVRVVTAVVSVTGLALTLWAVQIYRFDAPARRYIDVAGVSVPGSSYLDWIGRTGVGAWAMLLAFVVCLVAALLRPRRRRAY